MPRRLRIDTGGLVFHELNRRVGRKPLFNTHGDNLAFERTLAQTVQRTGIRRAAYCIMPNHRHLLVWAREDGELAEALRWLTVTHTQR